MVRIDKRYTRSSCSPSCALAAGIADGNGKDDSEYTPPPPPYTQRGARTHTYQSALIDWYQALPHVGKLCPSGPAVSRCWCRTLGELVLPPAAVAAAAAMPCYRYVIRKVLNTKLWEGNKRSVLDMGYEASKSISPSAPRSSPLAL